MSPTVARRWLLKSGTLALAGGLAGCKGDGDSTGDGADTTAETTAETVAVTDTTAPTGQAGCRIENALGGVEPVPVMADDSVESDAGTAVEVRWNARVQPTMAEDDSFGQCVASRGRAYVVFQLELTNVTDREVRVSPYDLFGCRLDLCDTTWDDEPSLYTLDATLENGVELAPDESTSGVVPFEVPRGLDRVTLVRYVDRDDEAEDTFRAVCDRGLSFDVGLAEE